MGAFNSNTPGLTPRLALLCNVSSLLMTVQINWSRCFILFFPPLAPSPSPPRVSLRGGNKQRLQLHLLQGSWLLNKPKKLFISEKKKQKGIKGEREGRAVGTGTSSTRASAVRCVKARSGAETRDRKTGTKILFCFVFKHCNSHRLFLILYVKVITARLMCVCARVCAINGPSYRTNGLLSVSWGKSISRKLNSKHNRRDLNLIYYVLKILLAENYR